jgi:hypothetical protein
VFSNHSAPFGPDEPSSLPEKARLYVLLLVPPGASVDEAYQWISDVSRISPGKISTSDLAMIQGVNEDKELVLAWRMDIDTGPASP